ncbi:MAG: c(7)-type cytochrome triheme domain-containing protein, partial [Nitrospinota bacterium]
IPFPPDDLPLDNFGMIDWLTGARENIYRPQSSLDGEGDEEETEDFGVGFVEGFNFGENRTGMGRLGGGIGGTLVFFPHLVHSVQVSCKTCHPKIFPYAKRGTLNMSMIKIAKGEFCGRCHGKVSFPIKNCGRCHLKLGTPK